MADWTIDEEMFRERLRTVADSLDAFAVASLLRDASVSLNEHDRQIVRQRAEIERLRAALDDAAEQADELQALIDAYAAAVVALGDDDRSATSDEWEGWIAASNALLAAATKEGDRG